MIDIFTLSTGMQTLFAPKQYVICVTDKISEL